MATDVVRNLHSLAHPSSPSSSPPAADDGYYTGVVDALVKIGRTEGLAGLYRGYVPSLLLTSNPAIQFMVYEQLSILFTRSRARSLGRLPANTQLSSWEYLLLGALAKAVATVITYPYQVLKSRQQADRSEEDGHRSLVAVARGIFEAEGLGAFTQGMGAKLVQTCLTAAVTFATYEKILTFVKKVASKYQLI
jgi:hypothetical protein